jgi:hypothetical protein
MPSSTERPAGCLWRLQRLGRARRALPLAGRWAGRFQGDLSKLAQYDFDGWATLEWECCLKDQEVGAREGVEFIDRHIIQVTGQVFDDFAGAPLALGRSSACWGLPRLATQWEHGHERSHRVPDDAFAHVYVQVEGLRIHCAVAGEGEPVLLVPGWPQTWYAWRHVLPALAAQGFKAIAVDPPGLGDSDRPEHGYDTGNVARLLHALMAQLGHERYHLVGHDVGMCGVRLASDQPGSARWRWPRR